MALFKPASKVRKNFKVCVYGPTGSGKTLFGLTFPGTRYIDMEGGVDWYIGRKIIPEQHDDFMLLQTSKAIDVIKAIEEVEGPRYGSMGINPSWVLGDAEEEGQDSSRESICRDKVSALA